MVSGLAGELLEKHQNSTQPSSQTLCAVLRATLEVLQSEGLEATPSALFAAVMSSLERPQGYSSPEVSLKPREVVTCIAVHLTYDSEKGFKTISITARPTM
jgi:hypothetical protein